MRYKTSSPLSFASRATDSPWSACIAQADLVASYLGHLEKWREALKRPKLASIVTVPTETDDYSVRHLDSRPTLVTFRRVPCSLLDNRGINDRRISDSSLCADQRAYRD
jgi:hypothetical protein